MRGMVTHEIKVTKGPLRQMIRDFRLKHESRKPYENGGLRYPRAREGFKFKSHYKSMGDIKQESTDVSLLNISVDKNKRGFSYRGASVEKVPVLLFGSCQEEKRPGPGYYNITNGDILEGVRKNRGPSLKSRHHLTQSFENSPGPAAYDLLSAKPRNIKNAFTMTKASRESSSDIKNRTKPGPQDYHATLPYRIKGTVPFGAAIAPKVLNDNPGPGTYTANSQLRRSPKFSFGSTRRFLNQSLDDLREGAGPAGYRPNYELVKVKHPLTKIGHSQRTEGRESSCSPGVGKYSPEKYKPKHTASVIFSTERRFMSNLQISQK